MQTKLLQLLLIACFSTTAMSNEQCVKSPTVSCLLALAKEDVSAIPEDDQKTNWHERYTQLLGLQLYHLYTSEDLDAAWPQVLQMPPSRARDETIGKISREMATKGDDKSLELVWEIEDDNHRIGVMLIMVEMAYSAGHKKLAATIFDDARFLLSRNSANKKGRGLYKDALKTAKIFDDDQLISSLKYDHQTAVAATSQNFKELRQAGAYRQSLQLAQQRDSGKSRYGAVNSVANSWLDEVGVQAMLNEVQINGDLLFRATSMYQIGDAVLDDAKPQDSLAYFEQAIEYADGLTSSEERDELYEDVARKYKEMSKNKDIDLDNKVLALSDKFDDWEKSLELQIDVVMAYIEADEWDRADAIIARVDSPFLHLVKYFMLMEKAGEIDDVAMMVSHQKEATYYLMQMKQGEIRSDVLVDLAKKMREIGEQSEARNLLLRALNEVPLLLPVEQVRMLKKCAGEYSRMGEPMEARKLLQKAFEVLKGVDDKKKMMSLASGLLDEASTEVLAGSMQQYFYEMEMGLQGKSLVDYYMMRARKAKQSEQYSLALRFITQALESTEDEKTKRTVFSEGLGLLRRAEDLPLLLSLLQHPSIPVEVQRHRVNRLFKEKLNIKRGGNTFRDYAAAWALLEIMEDEQRLDALVRLLATSVDSGEREYEKRAFSEFRRIIKESPDFTVRLIDLMLIEYSPAFVENYRDYIGKLIATLHRPEEELYYRIVFSGLDEISQEDVIKEVSALLPRVLLLKDRGGRAKILILLAMKLNGNAYP